jgi:hypothetical protein
MIFILLFIVIFPYTIRCCHPLCSYQCDNPVCPALCKIISSPPRCDICYRDIERNTSTCSSIGNNNCVVSCPPNECESDSCPVCSVYCNPLCRGRDNCYIQCQETMSSWKCEKPNNCPLPICILQCEAPACQYSNNEKIHINMVLLFSILFIYW